MSVGLHQRKKLGILNNWRAGDWGHYFRMIMLKVIAVLPADGSSGPPAADGGVTTSPRVVIRTSLKGSFSRAVA